MYSNNFRCRLNPASLADYLDTKRIIFYVDECDKPVLGADPQSPGAHFPLSLKAGASSIACMTPR